VLTYEVNYFSCIFSFWLTAPSLSQNSNVEDARIEIVKKNYISSNVGNVISGKNYDLKYLNTINSQFYKNSYPSEGSLLYDGVYFPLIEIQYDLFSQKVIVLLESKRNNRYVSIDTEKVIEFSIGNVFFERVINDSILQQGIYELAFNGSNSEVLIKRIKKRKEKTIGEKIMYVFAQQDLYFVKNRFGLFQVSNRKTFLNAYENSGKDNIIQKTSRKSGYKIVALDYYEPSE